MKKKTIIWLISLAAVLLAVILGCGIYVGTYYHADSQAAEAMEGSKKVTVTEKDGMVVFASQSPKVGFIFYPGGKVEHTAYAPLMLALAEQDVLCVLVEMPFRLAVLDMNAAEGIREQFPKVESWYIGGHSLGGSMAASYAAKHTDALEGLVLLAAYSTEDLSESGLRAISLYGSEDRVLNLEKYEKYRDNLPKGTPETVIPGGNHAFFGSYGSQHGDGEATITAREQWAITAELLLDFFKK